MEWMKRRGVQLASVIGLTLLVVWAYGREAAPSVHDIVSRSAEAVRTDWEKAPGFDFCRTEHTKDGTRTYQVMMIAGSPYNRLVAINGNDLSPAEDEDEARKFQAAVEHRKAETPQEQQQRIAQYQKERRRDQSLLEQMTDAMEYTMAGTQQIGPYSTYLLEAHPRPGYTPKSKEATVFTGMRGKLWIDQTSFRWVKVEAEVVHPVMIEGFLARVEPGTRFQLEELPVDKETWLASHFSMIFHAKVLLLFEKSSQADETYFHYTANGSLSPDSCRQP